MEKQSSGQQSARRKFFNWMMDWYYGKDDSSQVYNVPEVTDIVRLLTSTGFKLRRVEDTLAALDQQPVAENMDYSCRVVVSCAHSGIRVVLESEGVACCCPPVNKADGLCWEVTSISPTTSKNQESQTEVGSSFFPQVHSAVTEVTRSVISSLLRLMAEPFETRRPRSRPSHGSSYSNLLVPESSLARCSLRGSAPLLYGSQDKLLTDEHVMMSPIQFSRTSSHPAIEAVEIGQDLPMLKMKSYEHSSAIVCGETESILESVSSISASPSVECEEMVRSQASIRPMSAAPCVVPQELQTLLQSVTENLNHTLGLVESLKLALLSSQETTKELGPVMKSTPKKSYMQTPKVSKFKIPSANILSSKAQATSGSRTVTPLKRQQGLLSSTRVPTPRPVLKKDARTVARFGSGQTAKSKPDPKTNI